MEMMSPQQQGTKGDGFRIQVKENPNAFKNDSVVKGLADSFMTFSLRYGPDDPISIEKVKLDQTGAFNSEELQYAKAGDLLVEGLLEGKLVAQRSVENGDPIISHYTVKARTFRKVKVQEGIISVVFPIASWGTAILAFLSSLVTIYVFVVQRPKYNQLDRAALTGTHTIQLEPDKKSWTRLFHPGAPTISIGGPESKADITDAKFANSGPEPVMEIAVGLDGQYRIARTGHLDVSVNKTPLTAKQEVILTPMDKITVNNMQFTFTD
jgi:hypothetical protein